MIKKSFVSSLYVIPVTFAVILFATFLWNPNYLITPPQLSGFEQQIEMAISVLLIALYSFILPNKFEIELGIVNGYSTLKLTIIKVLPILLYTIITSSISIAIYQYVPFNLTEYKSIIPLYVPDNFKLYTFVSVFVTILFFSSIYFFMRVLTRNCYLPVIIDLLIFSALSSVSEGVRKGLTDLRVCLVDPFISIYFIGNTIPNEFSEKYLELSLMRNAWTINRIIFLTFSVVLLAVTVFLLRREKLHRGITE